MAVEGNRLPRVWRELEDEESLGLTPHEREIVEEFCTIICRRARIQFQDLPADGHEIIENVTTAEENLEQIIRSLRYCTRERERFIQNYPRWKRTRDLNVQKLKDIANALHSCKYKCNVSRLVGNTTSFIGGGMCVASAALIPFTFGLTTPLAVAGLCTSVTGSTVSAVSSVTEVAVAKAGVDDAQKTIAKDKREAEVLGSWLLHASELTEAMDSVMNTDVVKETMQILNDFIDKVTAIKKGNDKTEIICKTVGLLFGAKILASKTPQGALHLVTLLSIAVAIMMLRKRNQLIFDSASITFRGVLTVLSLMDASVDAAQALTSAAMGGAAVSRTVGKAVARGTFAVLSMSLDAVSIILTSIDLSNGSVSEHGEKILQVVEKMEEEGNVLARVYDAMTR